MADSDLLYLQPDFDPSSLTVPRLRSVLVTHNVPYPSSAKKPDLIQLFKQQVTPQATKLLTAQDNARRSSRGIVNVTPGRSHVNDTDQDESNDDDLLSVDPPASTRRSVRRTTRTFGDDFETATPRSRSTRSSVTPATSRRAADRSEHSTTRELKKKRSKQNLAAPVEESIEETNSHLTHDNPFQSGSSPASDTKDTRVKRRTTQSFTSPSDEGQKRKRRASPAPVRRPASPSPDLIDDIQPGEEFASDQDEELAAPVRARVPLPLAKRQKKKSVLATAAPWSVVVALLGGIATVWRQEKLQVGYCGVGRSAGAIAGVDLPDWATAMQPTCEPCPQHAFCYTNLRTVCENDFVLVPHPMSLSGLVPLPPTCEPDGQKVRKIKQVVDMAVETELREQNAQYECGMAKSPEVSVERLKSTVAAKRSRKLSDKEFNDLWESALGDINGREEVSSRTDSSITYLRSNSLAHITFGCAIKRSVRSTLRQHLYKLVTIVAVSLAGVYARQKLMTRTSTSARAKVLARVALDKLATQASLHALDNIAYPEPSLSMVALRDDVLREEFNAKERGRLWDVVKTLVENNSNVRPMVRESRTTGEVGRVWEWIGALQMIEVGDGTPDLRRQSSFGRLRRSIGPAVGGEDSSLASWQGRESGSGHIKAEPAEWKRQSLGHEVVGATQYF